MFRKTIFWILSVLVTFTSLVENDIDDFVVLADVFGWKWQEFVDDVREKEYIAACIAANPGHQLGDCALILKKKKARK